jgi:hypothetical protein
MFTITPWHFFDFDTAALAIYASHAVQQEDHKTPEWHELESPYAQMIIGRPWLVATGTFPFGAAAGTHIDFDTFTLVAKACSIIDEAREMVTLVQNGDQAHGKETDRRIE